MKMDTIVEEILNLENRIPSLLSSAGLSVLSETNVKMSVLLGLLNDQLSDLEKTYLTTKSDRYFQYLQTMKPTPAKDMLEFDKDLIEMKVQIKKLEDFIRTRERTILRVEKHLETETKLGAR